MAMKVRQLVALLLGCSSVAMAGTASAQNAQPRYETQLVAESRSPALCEADNNRVHVRFADGSACISYFVSTGPVRTGPTVFFFDGDVPLERFEAVHSQLPAIHRTVQRWSEATLTRYVFVSRPGVFGSSGNHAQRRTPSEMLAMNAAVDAIKARHGIGRIVLAGQSGGSTVAASLLTLGRRDVACAVLGSGRFNVVESVTAFRQQRGLREIPQERLRNANFDPTDRLASITSDPTRRIFVIGDPEDTRTLFAQQTRFADQLRALGHHAVAIEAIGTGELMHGVTYLTLPVAGQCARGLDDSGIAQYLNLERTRAISSRRQGTQSAARGQAG